MWSPYVDLLLGADDGACLLARVYERQYHGYNSPSIWSFKTTTLSDPYYSLLNIDVFRYILVVDISVLAKSNISRREYYFSTLGLMTRR
jgi:hypothetical protein